MGRFSVGMSGRVHPISPNPNLKLNLTPSRERLRGFPLGLSNGTVHPVFALIVLPESLKGIQIKIRIKMKRKIRIMIGTLPNILLTGRSGLAFTMPT